MPEIIRGVMDEITQTLKEHYTRTFEQFGPTARGVDWGREDDVILRYDKMLAVLKENTPGMSDSPSLLDVGCGYGGLYDYARRRNVSISYSGIDVCENMINLARQRFPDIDFHCGDVLEMQPNETFDYVVCNGILTQKLTASQREMDRYAHCLIRQMFGLARRGIAFNVMSTHVNFMVDNLYYRNPVELMAFCLSDITKHVRMDHAYPLYEYTLYLYREPGML